MFTINEIGIFLIIAEWYMLFFAKFCSHRVKNQKVMTENLSQQNALVLIMEPQDLEMPDFTEYNPEVSTLLTVWLSGHLDNTKHLIFWLCN